MNVILGAALVVSIVVVDWIKVSVLVLVIVSNSGIGFAQEYKSEKTMDALRNMSAPNARVLRNGEYELVPAKDIVPGDIVSLEMGDIVPADMRLIEAVNLETDEAFLTGESMPIAKKITALEREANAAPVGDRKNCAYMNSTVSKGRGVGVVVFIGFKTEVGKIATMVSDSKGKDEKTPLIRSLSNMMYACACTALVLGVVVFAVNKFEWSNDVFLYAISVGIAILPEGLPAVITVSFALGMKRMSKQKALVRRLAAIETVGQVTNICSDKTGTLTEGKMTVKEAWIGGHVYVISGKAIEPVGEMSEVVAEGENIKVDAVMIQKREALDNALLIATLCVTSTLSLETETNEWKAYGDPTEIALHVMAHKMKYFKTEIINDRKLEFAGEYPFDSSVKRMTTVYSKNGKYSYYVKGALERVLDLCDDAIESEGIVKMDQALKDKIHFQMEQFASKGMRVLALATKVTDEFSQESKREDVEKGLTLVGIVAIYDPPRAESLPAVLQCREAGIVVHMATGDHAKTAEAIARDVGILRPEDAPGAPLVLRAADFDKLTNEEIDAMAELPRVLARCSPETKVKLIHALHRRKKFVAMTGDGVNDAPAVKQADIGVAMGIAGSDVTKQAAEITLTDDNFQTIMVAVREGRRLFVNATNIAQHLLSGNVSEVIVLVIGLAIGDLDGLPVFPMSAIQILWLNMITSSPVALALGMEDAAKDVMKHPPRSTEQSLFSQQLLTDTAFYGIVLGAFSLGSFTYYIHDSYGLGSIPAGCAKKFAGEQCQSLFEARAVAFYSLSVLILIHGFNCRHSRYSMFRSKTQNKALWFSVLFGLATTLPTAFIPTVNTGMFEQSGFKPIWWLIILLQCFVFIIISEFYKFVKRFFFISKKSDRENLIVKVEN
jgi:potassium/sodium efflux P-type ATPase